MKKTMLAIAAATGNEFAVQRWNDEYYCGNIHSAGLKDLLIRFMISMGAIVGECWIVCVATGKTLHKLDEEL